MGKTLADPRLCRRKVSAQVGRECEVIKPNGNAAGIAAALRKVNKLVRAVDGSAEVTPRARYYASTVEDTQLLRRCLK
jgi:hypothetical protein